LIIQSYRLNGKGIFFQAMLSGKRPELPQCNAKGYVRIRSGQKSFGTKAVSLNDDFEATDGPPPVSYFTKFLDSL